MPAPRPARTLRELLVIRRQKSRWLRRLPGYLGSAVGYKYHEDTKAFARTEDGELVPAILVFVRRKLSPRQLRAGTKIPERFSGPQGLWCASDVVRGTLPNHEPPTPRPSARNKRLLRELHERNIGLVGGMPLAAPWCTGSAACAVRVGRKRGLLTNWHVAGFHATEILRPSPRLQIVGHTSRTLLTAPHTPNDPDDLESFTNAKHRVDAGLVLCPNGATRSIKPGVHGLGRLGKSYRLDLDGMAPIGHPVMGVGQTLGLQRGVIAAYGYEWRPDPDANEYCATDFLILGTDDAPFAAAGDSGKLVVTDDVRRQPIALLWGGQRQEFWTANAQEAWAYASDIGLVLRQLGAKILPA